MLVVKTVHKMQSKQLNNKNVLSQQHHKFYIFLYLRTKMYTQRQF